MAKMAAGAPAITSLIIAEESQTESTFYMTFYLSHISINSFLEAPQHIPIYVIGQIVVTWLRLLQGKLRNCDMDSQ